MYRLVKAHHHRRHVDLHAVCCSYCQRIGILLQVEELEPAHLAVAQVVNHLHLVQTYMGYMLFKD